MTIAAIIASTTAPPTAAMISVVWGLPRAVSTNALSWPNGVGIGAAAGGRNRGKWRGLKSGFLNRPIQGTMFSSHFDVPGSIVRRYDGLAHGFLTHVDKGGRADEAMRFIGVRLKQAADAARVG